MSCVWDGVPCNYDKILHDASGTIIPSKNIFNPGITVDGETENYRESILSSFDGFGKLTPTSKIFHSTSSREEWWKKYLPRNDSLGGVFFSTDVSISVLGGKSPLGVTLSYEIINGGDIILLFVKNRNELFETEEGKSIMAVGDLVAEYLVPFGFYGYYSCDECEIFLTNEAVKKLMDINFVTMVEDRRNIKPWVTR